MKSFVAMRHGWMQLDFYHSTSFEIIRDHSTSFDIIRHIRHHSTDLSCLCPSELSFGCNAFFQHIPTHLIGHRGVQGQWHCDTEFDSLAVLAVRGGTGKHV